MGGAGVSRGNFSFMLARLICAVDVRGAVVQWAWERPESCIAVVAHGGEGFRSWVQSIGLRAYGLGSRVNSSAFIGGGEDFGLR